MNKFTINTSMVASNFLRMALRLIYLTNLTHKPYLWYNFILIYQMKVINITALMQRIFFLLQKDNISTFDSHVVSHEWSCKSVIFSIGYLSPIICFFITFIIIDRAFVEPVYGKDIFDVQNVI